MTPTQISPQVVTEAQMPQAVANGAAGAKAIRRRVDLSLDLARLVLAASVALVVVFIYVGVPIALLVGSRLASLPHAVVVAAALVVAAGSIVLGVLHSTNLDVRGDVNRGAGAAGVDAQHPSPPRAPSTPGQDQGHEEATDALA